MKPKITQEQYNLIKDQSRVAKLILEDEGFKFIRDYIDKSIASLTEQLLTGVLAGTNIHITEVQTTEFQAQYRWIKQFMDDLKYYSSEFDELQKAIGEKKVYMEDKNVDTTEARG